VAVKEPDVYRIVEKIGDHFQHNINNRFMRKSLLSLELQQSEWDRLEGLTAKSDYYKTQGFQFDELYEMILAAAHFIYQARQKLVPTLSTSGHSSGALRGGPAGGTEQDKILRDMAVRNFPVNLGILTDLVNELYVKTTNLDRQAHGSKPPTYEKIPELKDIGRYLVVS
jgi:hypothetical protein